MWMDRHCPEAETITLDEILDKAEPRVRQQFQPTIDFLNDHYDYRLRTYIEYQNIYNTFLAQVKYS